MKRIISGVLALLATTYISIAEAVGTIIVNNDEWTLSNTGFTNAPDAALFATNIATLFGGGSATLHAYSTNFGFTGSSLSTTLSGAGHTYTTGTSFAFTSANIAGFDGLFLGGSYLSGAGITDLIAYVNAGGNVYLAGGTGVGGAAAEAAAWNPFLNAFGMSFASTYNGISGNINVTGATHPVFNGVAALYQDNGSSVSGAGIQVPGLYAVVPVPVPAALPLMGAGVLALLGFCRRRLS